MEKQRGIVVRLEGERIYLRELRLEDAQGNYPNWLNDPEVCRYNSHGDILYTKEMAKEYIKSIQNSLTCKVFAICENVDETHIGNISLQNISVKNKNAEFAILMGEKSFWGKGYAKEASDMLLEYGFNNLCLHRIYCGTSEANTPMQKLAHAMNMEKEGVKKEALFKDNKFYDVFEYAIVNETQK
ncbi:GNAT family N-acetyltransferase [Sulfurospirillum arcachonense]|uniref:GNAT family N-acetyltransferase n=1 Tax=Sulfurospirillum arcachonense TaxID=57666 RepID=UPI000A068E78|nr:GNAT family N-acetyltransferase [Sulfurospirillum arcachonense]